MLQQQTWQIIVNNTDLVNDGLEEACEISLEDVELQTCPEGTPLEGVAINSTFTDTTPADGIPENLDYPWS